MTFEELEVGTFVFLNPSKFMHWHQEPARFVGVVVHVSRESDAFNVYWLNGIQSGVYCYSGSHHHLEYLEMATKINKKEKV